MITKPNCDQLVMCILFSLALLFSPTPAAAALPDGWREVEFDGATHYAFNGDCWLARAVDSASGLVNENPVSIADTPWLHWRWRAMKQPDWPAVSEQEKGGDDFLARVYVIKKGWVPWRTRAINYVGSRQYPPGTVWRNPYADQAVIVVVQGPGGEGKWHSFYRNLREDFRRYHDADITEIDAVAIMTDTDNTGVTATACYQLPRFRRQGPAGSSVTRGR